MRWLIHRFTVEIDYSVVTPFLRGFRVLWIGGMVGIMSDSVRHFVILLKFSLSKL